MTEESRSPSSSDGPAKSLGGRDVDRIADAIDVLPTILDLCGVSLPRDIRPDGISLSPLMFGPARDWPNRTLFFQQCRPDRDGVDVAPPFHPRRGPRSAVQDRHERPHVVRPVFAGRLLSRRPSSSI